MKIDLLALSSSGDPYRVEFVEDQFSVRVFCHCQAGINQMLCKHKVALLKGDAKMLFDPGQTELLKQIQLWKGLSGLKQRLEEFENQLKEIEAAKGVLAKKEKGLKTQFNHGLTFGFK